MADNVEAKSKGGRPRKYASEAKRPTLTFRVRGGLYEKLKASSEQRELSMSEEIERRLEQSYDNDLFRGPASQFFQDLRKVMIKVLSLSADHVDYGDDSPEENECSARRELYSAIDFINRVYTTVGEPLPEEFSVDGVLPGDWGSGDVGRLHAQVFLDDWADDPIRLARARAREVDFYWTQSPSQRSLDDIMAEKNSGRDRSATTPVRPSDSGPDEDNAMASANVAVQKPKRARKAKPQA